MKKNGYTTKELLVVIIVLGVFTLGILGTTSNAYKDHSEEYYEQTINIIEKQAELYGESLTNLKEEGSLVITLSDLVSKGYFVADDSYGNVNDPRNSKNTLNGLKIKLTYEKDGVISAKVIEEE
jgi:competence protein ComGC